jgi:hypothetical protein
MCEVLLINVRSFREKLCLNGCGVINIHDIFLYDTSLERQFKYLLHDILLLAVAAINIVKN